MAMDRYLIAPINSGLVNNSKPWIQPDDAFETLQNIYVFRGRLRKRFGSQLMGPSPLNSRLGVSLGNNTNAAINLPANTTAHTPQLAIGQSFSLGSDIFTVYQLGAGVATYTTNVAVTAVINSVATPNTITFTGGALIPVYWYPSLPVMGIDQFLIGTVNNHPTYAFDTEFAYTFAGGVWTRSGAAVWNGTNLNYFWAGNWQGVAGVPLLFVSNFNFTVPAPGATDDPIWYFDGTTWTAATGANAFYFRPAGGAIHTGPYIKTARIIVPFKNRLVLLNTVENANGGGAGVNTNFINRARWCFYGSPLATNAWYEKNQQDNVPNIASGGGFADAATDEAIIGAEFIKDRLIVYFERSTWEFVYTGNQVNPFVWQKINTELGSQSTFSVVPFDKDVLTIGNSGVHACSGANVRRIDDKIPDQVFEFETENNATLRTCGIRDYFTEMVYWSYVSDIESKTQVFPNQVLAYNYKNGSWSINDDCFTTFGYFEQQADLTWASSVPVTWQRFNGTWISNVIQANQRQILGGTPEGFVLQLNVEESRNAPSMYITGMSIAATGIITLTIIGHNLDTSPNQYAYDSDFILIENVVADAATELFLNGKIFQVNPTNPASNDTITIDTQGGLVAGLYAGGGTCARVSNIQVTTKEFNPYVDQDSSVYVAKVDFAVERTAAGAITVDYLTSSAPLGMIAQGVASGAIMGNSILETSPYDPLLYPLEQYQDLLWHPLYFGSSGEFIQLNMYFSLEQMLAPAISLSPFELEALCLYTQRTSNRMQ